jgi:tetratricopeptide (TPR) repeat protein/transcriptional regulator with XRE-family HTH domain
MRDYQLSNFGDLLKTFRKRAHIVQQELAARLGVHRNTIGSWERGDFLPESKTLVLELARQLQLDAHDTRRLLEASLTGLSPYWYVPYQRNPFFTGREEVLQRVHKALHGQHTALLCQSSTLSGLGGVGKTQTAIEYAYRYANDYAAVFWVSAETAESLTTSFLTLAEVLALPEQREHEPSKLVTAVIRWLNTHSDWLLIFDNVEDIELVKRFLPSSRRGALLFTSRQQALGFTAQALDLQQMTLEEGMHLLLYRARLLEATASPDQLTLDEQAAAKELVTLMDALPLALDQAGAYIEATQCSLTDYLHLFQTSSLALLDKREAHADHPQSVAATVAFAVERVQAQAPVAADLLRLCAFLSPDNIPQELFVRKVGEARGPWPSFDPLEWDKALGVLRRYSLINRQADTGLLSLHRLVQVVLKARMDHTSYRQWAYQAVETVNFGFPAVELLTTWSQCQRVLPHAQVCATLIEEEQIVSEAAGRLLQQLGTYLLEEAQYAQAENYLTRAYAVRVRLFGEQHPVTADSLNYLAELAYYQGNYQQAEQQQAQALRIREQKLGPQHPDVAISLNNLASAYWIQGKYRQAEPLYRRALQIREEVLGSEHLDTAEVLQNLGTLLLDQGRYDEAEPPLERCLKIWRQILGSEHLYLMTIWNNLGRLYYAQGRYAEAEQLYLQAKTLGEQAHTTQHPFYAITLNNLANLACTHQEWEQAESWYREAFQIRESVLGPGQPRTVQTLHDLATLYAKQGQVEQASELYQRVLALREKILPPEHPDTAETLHQFALLREAQGNAQEAIALYQRALPIREQVFGAQHPKTIATRKRLRALLHASGMTEETAPRE